MELKLGNKYTEKEAAEFHRKESPNTTYKIGITADGDWFIRFGSYEFWQTKKEFKEHREKTGSSFDALYMLRKSPEGYHTSTAAPVDAFSFHDKSRRKTAAYYTRDTQATRDAKKWGYRPQG